jgi:hypothetical protein
MNMISKTIINLYYGKRYQKEDHRNMEARFLDL